MERLLSCKNVSFLGLWEDPEGVYPTMPLFELREDSVEEWNKKVIEQRRKNEQKNL